MIFLQFSALLSSNLFDNLVWISDHCFLYLSGALASPPHSVDPYLSDLEILSVTSPASSSFVPVCALKLPNSNKCDY